LEQNPVEAMAFILKLSQPSGSRWEVKVAVLFDAVQLIGKQLQALLPLSQIID
jgi:hypothetical protein